MTPREEILLELCTSDGGSKETNMLLAAMRLIESKNGEISRLSSELEDTKTRLRIEKECGMGVKYSIVDTVGGVDYEGNATSTINYLQRLRILVDKEHELERLQSEHLALRGKYDNARSVLREFYNKIYRDHYAEWGDLTRLIRDIIKNI